MGCNPTVDSAQRVAAGLCRWDPSETLQPLVVLQLIVQSVTPLIRAQPHVLLRNDVVTSISMESFQRSEVERRLISNPQHIEVLVAEVPNGDVFHLGVHGRQRKEWRMLCIELLNATKWDPSLRIPLPSSVKLDSQVVGLDQHVVNAEIHFLSPTFCVVPLLELVVGGVAMRKCRKLIIFFLFSFFFR